MSSTTSRMAQIGRRINYFRCLDNVTGYTVSVNTANYNSWTAEPIAGNSAVLNDILQDMGEIAKFGGQILRKVRNVTRSPAGGDNATYWIVMPGGEYPTQGVQPASTLTIAPVARLG